MGKDLSPIGPGCEQSTGLTMAKETHGVRWLREASPAQLLKSQELVSHVKTSLPCSACGKAYLTRDIMALEWLLGNWNHDEDRLPEPHEITAPVCPNCDQEEGELSDDDVAWLSRHWRWIDRE
jgi:hypothetical protein